MAQEYRIDTVLITNRVRLNNDAKQGVVGLPSAAWYGEPAVAGVRIDDPLGELDLRGWHTFTHDETSCTGNERTFSGWIIGKTIDRGPFRYGAARVWECEVHDLNTAFSLEVFRASSAKRPEETDIERVAWAQASAPMAGTPLADNGRFNTTDNPVGFGPSDYVTQFPQGLFESVAGTSGKNFFAYFDQSANEPSLHYDLVGVGPTSTLAISNVESDADSTTFYPFIDASLSRSAADQVTGVLFGYLGGNYVYARNDLLIAELSPTEFSPVNFLRDAVYTTDRVGKLATANALVQAQLAARAVEVDTITCAIRVPASQVNLLMAGDLVDVKFSHLPGYEDFVTVPVTRRNVIPSDGRRDMYDLHLTLSNEIQAVGPGGGDPGEGPYQASCEIGDAVLEHSQGVVVATEVGITDSWTFTISSAPTPGNLMWVAWYAGDNAPPSPGTYDMPGWTWHGQASEVGVGGGPAVVNVFTKVAEAGESLTPVVNDTGIASIVAPEYYAYMEWSGLGDLDTAQTTEVPTGFTGQCTTVHTPTAGLDVVILSAAGGNQGLAYPGAGTSIAGGTIIDESPIAVDAIGNVGYQIVTDATGSYVTGTDRPSGTAHAGVSTAFLPCGASVPPGALMHVKNEFVADGDGTTATFTTRFPYAAGTLEPFVDGVPIINGYTEIDPDAGTFSLDFAPQAASGDTRAERLTVNYQANVGGPGT